MSYDPTCKKWKRRYETNVDTRLPAHHFDQEEWDEQREAMDFPADEDVEDDRWVPLEYEVQAAHQGGPNENWMWIAEYAGEQEIDSQSEVCPISIGTSNPSSPGWRRTCERTALSTMRENLSYSEVGEPDSLFRFHKSRDKEIRITPTGPWECVE